MKSRTISALLAITVSGFCVVAAAPSSAERSVALGSPTAFVPSASLNSVTPFNTATDKAGTPIPVGARPQGGLITPDGKLLFVGNSNDGTVSVIDTATGTVESQIPCAGVSAISPPSPDVIGGPVVYLGCANGGAAQIVPYLVRNGQLAAPWNISGGIFALSPDGLTAWIANASGLIPYSVEFGTSGTPIVLPKNTAALRFSPDGKTLWTGNLNPDLTPYDVTTGTFGAPIRVAGDIHSLAISPDGNSLYVLSYINATVTPIDVASGTVGTPILVPKHPQSLVMTPDAKTLFVLPSVGSKITPIDLKTDVAGTPFAVTTDPLGLSIEPDQAPVAVLSVSAEPHGSPTAFDASGSHVQFGKIVRYRWQFGDGSTATTSSPSTNHTYAVAGKYQVSVTETDSAGTSTSLLFNGQMVVRNGGPSARATQPVVIP